MANQTPDPSSMTNSSTDAKKPQIIKKFDLVHCKKLELSSPIRWVILGVLDFLKAPAIGLFFGLCFALAGALIIQLTQWQGSHIVILPSLILFMIIGPLLALGLYDASDAILHTNKAKLSHAILSITKAPSSFWLFTVFLVIIMIFWTRIAAILHAFYPIVEDAPFIDYVPFLAIGSVIGFIFLATVFCCSAFTIPLMIDRQSDIITAIASSVNAVIKNLLPMLFWAFIILVLTFLGFLTYGLGLLIVTPVLGFATWHAYQEILSK